MLSIYTWNQNDTNLYLHDTENRLKHEKKMKTTMWKIESATETKYSYEQALMIAYARYLSYDYQMILLD